MLGNGLDQSPGSIGQWQRKKVYNLHVRRNSTRQGRSSRRSSSSSKKSPKYVFPFSAV